MDRFPRLRSMDLGLVIAGVVLGAIGTVSGLAGVLISIRGTRNSSKSAREANDAAQRSADAAERSAEASKRSAAVAEQEIRRHRVAWELHPLGEMKWELINVSYRDSAYHVRIEHSGINPDLCKLYYERIYPSGSVLLFILRDRRSDPTEPLRITWYADEDKSGPPHVTEKVVP